MQTSKYKTTVYLYSQEEPIVTMDAWVMDFKAKELNDPRYPFVDVGDSTVRVENIAKVIIEEVENEEQKENRE